jgi:cytochrome c oxidase cbb3-type subunit III
MRRSSRVLALVIALAAGGVGAAGGCSSSPSVPADPTLAKGQQIYNQNCSSCHGEKGEGVLGPRLIGIAKTYPDVTKQIAVISNGVKGSSMPAWKDKLSADDIRAVAEYTRSLT